MKTGRYSFRFQDDLYGAYLSVETTVANQGSDDDDVEAELEVDPGSFIYGEAGTGRGSRRRRQPEEDSENENEDDGDAESDNSFIVDDEEEEEVSPDASGSEFDEDEEDEEAMLERQARRELGHDRHRGRRQQRMRRDLAIEEPNSPIAATSDVEDEENGFDAQFSENEDEMDPPDSQEAVRPVLALRRKRRNQVFDEDDEESDQDNQPVDEVDLTTEDSAMPTTTAESIPDVQVEEDTVGAQRRITRKRMISDSDDEVGEFESASKRVRLLAGQLFSDDVEDEANDDFSQRLENGDGYDEDTRNYSGGEDSGFEIDDGDEVGIEDENLGDDDDYDHDEDIGDTGDY
ncbi:hypothetical protein PINS_up000720 [Pythium insidiosum]|nr:hypothetical protein PINS_up000720 [Pythium insidiosum]